MEDRGPITVTITDTKTGTVLVERTIQDDYILVEHGRVYLDGVQKYSNGTTILTLKTDPAKGRT